MSLGGRTSMAMYMQAMQPMPVIPEDEDLPPAIPPRSHRRRSGPSEQPVSLDGSNALVKHYYYPESYSYSTYSSYPMAAAAANPQSPGSAYASDYDLSDDRKSEPAEEEQHQQPQRRRGCLSRAGWYRLALIVFVATSLAVGLGLGLALGLRQSGPAPMEQTRSGGGGGGQALAAHSFPAGSYSFNTALTDVNGGCSADPAVFGCYPYASYSAGAPEQVAATFQWTIKQREGGGYVVSSSDDNPLAPQFVDVPMTTLDAESPTERFVFNFTTAKSFVPTLGPTSSLAAGWNNAETCWYNTTVVGVQLWTKQRGAASYYEQQQPKNNTTSTSCSFDPWPYKIDMSQVQKPGASVPDCRAADGASAVGAPSGAGGDCQCLYRNFDLPGNKT